MQSIPFSTNHTASLSSLTLPNILERQLGNRRELIDGCELMRQLGLESPTAPAPVLKCSAAIDQEQKTVYMWPENAWNALEAAGLPKLTGLSASAGFVDKQGALHIRMIPGSNGEHELRGLFEEHYHSRYESKEFWAKLCRESAMACEGHRRMSAEGVFAELVVCGYPIKEIRGALTTARHLVQDFDLAKSKEIALSQAADGESLMRIRKTFAYLTEGAESPMAEPASCVLPAMGLRSWLQDRDIRRSIEARVRLRSCRSGLERAIKEREKTNEEYAVTAVQARGNGNQETFESCRSRIRRNLAKTKADRFQIDFIDNGLNLMREMRGSKDYQRCVETLGTELQRLSKKFDVGNIIIKTERALMRTEIAEEKLELMNQEIGRSMEGMLDSGGGSITDAEVDSVINGREKEMCQDESARLGAIRKKIGELNSNFETKR